MLLVVSCRVVKLLTHTPAERAQYFLRSKAFEELQPQEQERKIWYVFKTFDVDGTGYVEKVPECVCKLALPPPSPRLTFTRRHNLETWLRLLALRWKPLRFVKQPWHWTRTATARLSSQSWLPFGQARAGQVVFNCMIIIYYLALATSIGIPTTATSAAALLLLLLCCCLLCIVLPPCL